MGQLWRWGLCTFLFLTGSSQAAEEGVVQPAAPAVSTQDQHFNMVVQDNNRLAFSLLSQLNSGRGNFYVSSYSIASGLARLSLGARRETANEIHRVLNYSSSFTPLVGSLDQFFTAAAQTKNAAQLYLANAVWLQEDISVIPAYQFALKRSFASEAQLIDFKREFINSVKLINEWTSKQTNNRIHQILHAQEVDDKTQFVLTTALYVKGGWARPFDVRQTVRKLFHISDKQTRHTEMMHATGDYPILLDEAFTLIEIPYAFQEGGQWRLSLMIFMPKDKLGWQQAGQSLTVGNWQKWTAGLRPRYVHLGLPRFRIEDRFQLDSLLKEMGIKQAFTEHADFSGITEMEGLILDHVVHKTLIRVDERGSDAAYMPPPRTIAAQAASQEEPLELLIDQPFFFFLVEKSTQSILSVGRIIQP